MFLTHFTMETLFWWMRLAYFFTCIFTYLRRRNSRCPRFGQCSTPIFEQSVPPRGRRPWSNGNYPLIYIYIYIYIFIYLYIYISPSRYLCIINKYVDVKTTQRGHDRFLRIGFRSIPPLVITKIVTHVQRTLNQITKQEECVFVRAR